MLEICYEMNKIHGRELLGFHLVNPKTIEFHFIDLDDNLSVINLKPNLTKNDLKKMCI